MELTLDTALAQIQLAMARIALEMDQLAQQITAALWQLKTEWWKERYQQAAALFATALLLGSSFGLWITTHVH
jgi:hypothetical protein